MSGLIVKFQGQQKGSPCGPMDKASAYEAEDSGFEPRHGFFKVFFFTLFSLFVTARFYTFFLFFIFTTLLLCHILIL